MNRRPQGLPLSKAIDGFLQCKTAEALSPRTIESYKRHLDQWLEHIGDRLIHKVTTHDLRSYLAWLHTEYTPGDSTAAPSRFPEKRSGTFGSPCRHCSRGPAPSSILPVPCKVCLPLNLKNLRLNRSRRMMLMRCSKCASRAAKPRRPGEEGSSCAARRLTATARSSLSFWIPDCAPRKCAL